MRTHFMPWSFWLATAMCAGFGIAAAIQDRPTWWEWFVAAFAVALVGTGIRAWTDELHYKRAHSPKGEDHDDSPVD